jgi:Protein of unknown function (DUF1116)
MRIGLEHSAELPNGNLGGVDIPTTIDYARPFSQARWFDVLPRSTVCPELSARVLLHAGPPFRGAPPAPVVNAAIQALIFEGLANDAAAARDILEQGAVQLQPAQDHGIVVPLAQVVSASMPLAAVRQQGKVCYAPLLEARNPALRFGCAAPECLQRLRDVGDWIREAVVPTLHREPLAVDEVVRLAVAAGEECHSLLAAANEAMVSRLTGIDIGVAARLRENSAFVLTLLMAAAAASLRVHRCDLAAIGGNGVDFGVRYAGEATWRQVPAEAPRGTRLAGMEAVLPLGAIGDSAVIDFCGLGGQALAQSPTLAKEWRGLLPADAFTRRQGLVDPESGIVDPRRIAGAARAPLINLAILDRDGMAGLIGRGFYCPPEDLFS